MYTIGNISIHALREEGDGLIQHIVVMQYEFLSTPSARRATADGVALAAIVQNFYPRPPRGGRLLRHILRAKNTSRISIHALREEGDPATLSTSRTSRAFLSTPSARRATGTCWRLSGLITPFLSTPSARRATAVHGTVHRPEDISIHALREEGDDTASASITNGKLFLSTPSARRATAANLQRQKAEAISIHALREEGDTSFQVYCAAVQSISIHALREEGDQLRPIST